MSFASHPSPDEPRDPRRVAADPGPYVLAPAADDSVWGGSRAPAEPGSRNPAPVTGADAAPPRRRMSTMAKGVAAAGVAAVIAIGGTVAITSASADNTAAGGAGTASAAAVGGAPGNSRTGTGTGTGGAADATGGSAGGQFAGRGGFGSMAALSVLAGALHGDFVVAQGNGTVTERLQTGTVTAVTSTSTTVRSSDNYVQTYVVGTGVDATAATSGATVTVIATVHGSAATATSITAARTAAAVGGTRAGSGGAGVGSGGAGAGGAGSAGGSAAPSTAPTT